MIESLSISLFTQVFDATSQGLIAIDENGQIVLWNQWLVNASGIQSKNALGKKLPDLFPKDLSQRLLSAVTDAITKGHSAVLSSSFTRYALPLRHPLYADKLMTQKVVIKAFQIQDQNYCLLNITDISLGAQRESLLQQHRENLELAYTQLSHVLENVGEAILTTDDTLKVTSINPAAEALFGVKSNQALQTPLMDYIPKMPALKFGESSELVCEGFFGFQKKRQGVLAISVNCSRWNQMIWLIRDVTQSKRSEAALIEAKQIAEAASIQKAAFLANMSHEIRTPMNGVLGMADLLFESNLNPDQLDYVETIRKSGDALLTIINDILDFSKIDTGKIEIQTIPFDLRELVETVIDLTAKSAHERGLELTYIIKPIGETVFMGDPFRIQQILLNFVSNAVKFTAQGAVTISCCYDQGCLRMEVEDTGIGIAKEDHHLLFDPFSQVEYSTTRRFGGTGLGLAISKKLAELMGGTVNFNTEVGKGSTFWAEVQIKATPSPLERIPRDGFDHLQCLFVSANPWLVQFMTHQLSYWQIKTIVISDFDLLNEQEIEKSFDVVILDEQFQASQTIRTDPRFFHSHLLQLKSRNNRNAPQWGQTEECESLLKPPRLNDIFRQIIKLLNYKKMIGNSAFGSTFEEPKLMEFDAQHILLVEDNKINQKVLKKMLEKMNLKCDIAENGAQALEAFDIRDYDLIIMDCQMPILNGYEATQKIRHREALTGKHTPILAMTAHALDGDAERCYSAGMDDYMSKPIHKADLCERVSHWLNGNSSQ